MTRVHHLNCGTMVPPATPGLVCHVLLVETGNGLTLVDTGFGLLDGEMPARRIGPSRFLIRPTLDPAEAAVRQVVALGYEARDVRNIVLTHFDVDHVGGIADFPWADVHLTAAEAYGSLHPKTVGERARYRSAQRDHHPRLVEHTPDQGESWHGFAGAKELTEIGPGVVLISLPGHTRGHAAIAVESDTGWVLHVGDAFYHRGQLDGTRNVPRTLMAMERVVAYDWKLVRANHDRLTELWNAAEPGVTLVNAHDSSLLQRALA